MAEIFVNYIIKKAITNITLTAHCSYFRLTFIKQNKCYICRNYNCKKVYERHSDDMNGMIHYCGWLYCKDCKPIIEMSERYIELNSNHLFKYTTTYLHNIPLHFSKFCKKIKQTIHIHNAKLCVVYDSFRIIKNRIMVYVQWGNYGKYIYFSNLLFYNPKIFGEFIDHCKPLYYCTYKHNKMWRDKWYPKFKYEYEIAYIWRHISNIQIPMVCLDKILDYWGEF